jgi:hypothetical protein
MRGSGKLRGRGKGTKSSGPPFTSSEMGDAATDPISIGQAAHAVVLRIAGGLPRLKVLVPAAPMSGGDDRSRRE